MSIALETLNSRFNPTVLVDFLSKKARPSIGLTTLFAFGSVTQDRFDAYGDKPGRSDIDLLGVSGNNFRHLNIPNWSIVDQKPNQAQALGTLDGRDVQLLLLSEDLLGAVLDNFVAMANLQNPYQPGVQDESVWEFMQRLYQCQLVWGYPPAHEAFDLMRQPDAPIAFRIIRRPGPLNPWNILEAFS